MVNGGGVSAVIFDWGGTLTPWHTIDPGLAWRAAVGDERLAAQLLGIEAELWLRCRDEHLSGTLEEVFERAGVTPTAQMLDAFHEWWDPHTYTDPDVVPLFTALGGRGIRVGVLSNTVWPRSRHESIFVRDGVHHLIDGAVYTSEIPWTKPHPEAFRAAMAAVGASEPDRCVFVGDRLFDDIHGAKSAGMLAVHVPHSTIPVEQHGHTDGEPDAVVQRLIDLVEVIEGWN